MADYYKGVTLQKYYVFKTIPPDRYFTKIGSYETAFPDCSLLAKSYNEIQFLVWLLLKRIQLREK